MWQTLRTHKPQAIGVTLALLVVLSFAGSNIFGEPAAIVPKITESHARLGDIAVSIENDGVISAEKAVLNFSQTGVLASLNVKVGDSVNPGDLLAQLDTSKLTAQVNQAQATYNANREKVSRLASGGAEVVAKQVAVNSAQVALTAEEAIYNDVVIKNGVGSSQELAEAAKLRKAEADVASAQSQLAITTASYNDAQFAASASYAGMAVAQATLYDALMTAPSKGIVTSINGAVGQTVGGSQTTQNGFITITNPESITMISKFDEEDISKIKVGQAIKAEFLALNATLDGYVTYISPAAQADQNGVVSYEVRSQLTIGEHKVLDGMSATVQFITKQISDVIVVPNKAITRVNGKSVISYYDNQKQIVTKQIVTGFTDGTSVAITQGIEVGDDYLIIQ